MSNDEIIPKSRDKIKKLSQKDIAIQRKERASKLKEKLGLSNSVPDFVVLDAENKIYEKLIDNVAETEDKVSLYEGNIAENLADAALTGNDGDISTALSNAKVYHITSNNHVQKILNKKKQQMTEEMFKDYLMAA